MKLLKRVAMFALAAYCTPVWSTPVTVTLASAGANVPDGIVVVFDPLDAKPPPTQDTASIDQVNRRFVPAISVVRTGTSVRFPNSDNVRHQVYSFSESKTFTLKLYSGQPSSPVTFDKPGLVVLGCNIHDRMAGFLAVVDTPYFGKADASGTLSINLPPGRYRMRIWHPTLTAPVAPQELTVKDASLSVRVPVSVDPSAQNVAAWPE